MQTGREGGSRGGGGKSGGERVADGEGDTRKIDIGQRERGGERRLTQMSQEVE